MKSEYMNYHETELRRSFYEGIGVGLIVGITIGCVIIIYILP